jgi:hypothetical protein
VAVKDDTRCLPNKEHVARYRELQRLQDALSASLRDIFPKQREVTEAMNA